LSRSKNSIAALNHPNICTLYDIGPDFLVMEFIDGAPLSGPTTLDDSLSFGQQIAAALEAAHDRGILHRDLRPANVLVSGRTAKLLDFGIAQRTSPGDADVTQPRFQMVSGAAAVEQALLERYFPALLFLRLPFATRCERVGIGRRSPRR